MQYRFDKKNHVHELSKDGVSFAPLYGTTTLINEVYPPPLAWYGSAKALELLGYMPQKKEPDEVKRRSIAEDGLNRLDELLSTELRLDEYISFLEKCYKNHDTYKKSKGKEGTDMHAKIEEYIKACLERGGEPEEMKDNPFAEWALKEVKQFLWSEGNCFSERLWIGGITDFGFVHKNGRTYVGDAKPSVYPKHFIQTASYGLQIAENGLFDGAGKRLLDPLKVDGYCIFDYNKGEVRYVDGELKPKLELIFENTVEVYKLKDLTGAPIPS